MKNLILSFCTILLLISSCSESDNVTQPYEKDWTLNLSDYLGSDYTEIDSYKLSDFGLTLLNERTALVHEFSKKGRHLVEVDYINGSFQNQSSINFGLWSTRKRGDQTILISGYDSDNFILGTYNENIHAFSSFSPLESDKINDPTDLKAIYAGDDILYTHDPNISPNNNEVYVAKWNFDGEQIWRKNIDPTSKNKIAEISTIQTDYLLYSSVEDFDLNGGRWKVGKLSKDGDVLWHKKLNDFGRIIKIFQSNSGDFIVLNEKSVSKHDTNGNLIWKNELSNYQNAFTWGNGVATNDGGVVFQLQSDSNEEFLMKIDSTGKVVWEQAYWEVEPNKQVTLTFLELPSKDLLVLSSNGYLTLYRSK
jgi:hypothetical protein